MNPFRKLTPKAREILKEIEPYLELVEIAKISNEAYDILLNCVDTHSRKFYRDTIPYKGKKIMRVGARNAE